MPRSSLVVVVIDALLLAATDISRNGESQVEHGMVVGYIHSLARYDKLANIHTKTVRTERTCAAAAVPFCTILDASLSAW
jgi:hypothetical protein